GSTRTNIGNGLFFIATAPVGLAKAELVAVTGEVTTGGIAFHLHAGIVPEVNLGSFTSADLTTSLDVTDLDKGPIGQKAGFVAYTRKLIPGSAYFAVLGPGALLTSSGLNFLLVDVASGQTLVNVGGTGQNLLQNND